MFTAMPMHIRSTLSERANSRVGRWARHNGVPRSHVRFLSVNTACHVLPHRLRLAYEAVVGSRAERALKLDAFVLRPT